MSTLQAFHGDAGLKNTLINSVRDRWMNHQLIPGAVLMWSPEKKFFSLNGSLIESEDPALYEQRIGIPVTLALLCEAMVTASIVAIPDATQPSGYAFEVNDEILGFGLQWLEAIRPGADLSGVLPAFMIDFMGWFLSSDFPLHERMDAGVGAVATRIVELWKSERADTPVDEKAWRAVRKDAVLASEACTDLWSFDLAIAVESLAWPADKIRAEFKQFFMIIVGQASAYLQQPYLHPDDQANTVAMFEARHAMSLAEEEGPLDQQAAEQLFESRPSWSQALAGRRDDAVMGRVRMARVEAMQATDRCMRQVMDRMLRLLSAA